MRTNFLRQKRASISGDVEDVDSGTVLGDAKIGIRRKDSDNIILSALSSTRTGQYEIDNIPSGKYILVFTRVGYEKGYSGGGDNENSAEEVRLFYPPVKICATRILQCACLLIAISNAKELWTPLIPVNGLEVTL